MTSYLFSFGDSSYGPVGCVVRVIAESKDEALEILQESLPEEVLLDSTYFNDLLKDPRIRVEYANVYFNPNFITTDHIDELESEPVEEVEDVEP